MSGEDKLNYKIKEKYSQEILDIEYILNNMESGRIYGINGNHCTMDGSLQKNCENLRKEFFTLLKKIQNGLDSKQDKINEIFSGKEL